MADLLARFKLVDEMSDRLSRMAASGQDALTKWEQAGDAVNSALGGLSGGVNTAVSSVDSVTKSIDRLQEQADSAADAQDRLSASLNKTEKNERDFTAAVYEAARAERASRNLADSLNEAEKNGRSLANAADEAARASKELADSDNVSVAAKEALIKANQEAEDALKELYGAQEQARNAQKEYDRMLSSGVEDLEAFEQAAQKVSTATTELDAANRRATDATGELSGAFERASKEAAESVDDVSRATEAAGDLADVLVGAGILTLVSRLADEFMRASEAAAVFEVGMKKISTIVDTSQVSLGQISSDILALSMDTGIFADSLEEAAYAALSASVNTADAVQFTGTASRLAAGGFTSSATAVDILTTALNAYGLEAGHAENISDMLITTQNLGKTTVDELAASVGKVIPLASAYGVEMDNLSAAYAELTKGGIATAEAGTYLKSMLNELGDSGSVVSAVLSEQTGQSFSQLMAQGASLGDIMAVLGESVNGNAGAFNELWSSSEAGIGALSLYNAGADQFNSTLNAMQSSVGATKAAYEAMTDTTSHAQEELSNAANNLQISIGQQINPMVKAMYELGTDVLNGMTKFIQEHPVFTKVLSSAAIGLGVAAAGMVGFSFAVGKASKVIAGFGVSIYKALGPVGLAATAVTGLVAAGAALHAMMEEAADVSEHMTMRTRAQQDELQVLNAEYEKACNQYGSTSEEAGALALQISRLTDECERNGETIGEFAAKIEQAGEAIGNTFSGYEEAVSSADDLYDSSISLASQLLVLSNQSDTTGTTLAAMSGIVDKLNADYSDLGLTVDETTGKLNYSISDLYEFITQAADEQKQQAAMDALVESLGQFEAVREASVQASGEVAAAWDNYDALEKKWQEEHPVLSQLAGSSAMNWSGELGTAFREWETLSEAAGAAHDNYDTLIEDIRIYCDALGYTGEETDEFIRQIESSSEATAQFSGQMADMAEDTTSWQEAVSTAYECIRTDIEELCQAYDEAYEAALESFEGQYGLFDEASMKSDDYRNATVSNAQKALESQLSYWENYSANIDTLKEQSAESLGVSEENYQALMSYVQDGSEQAAGLAESMARALEEGNTEAVTVLANTLGEVTAKQEELAGKTADWQTDFTEKMRQYEEEMQGIARDMDLSNEARESAAATITAYADQILVGKDGAVKAAESVSRAVAAALSSADTTVHIKTTTATGIPGHARGTTNAENLFLAGEKGPELIVRPAAAYASGTTDSTDFFIAGENGPELIVGESGSTVFPTSETDRLLSALNDRRQPFPVIPGPGTGAEKSGSEGALEQVKRILIEIAGSGAIEVGGARDTDRAAILEVLYEHLRPVLINLIQNEIYEEGELAYEY